MSTRATETNDLDQATLDRLVRDITIEFRRYGALVARTEDVGDPELWRVAARKAAHDLGAWCATGYYGPAKELVWARPQNRPVNSADRQDARRAVEEAVVVAMGAALSEELLPD